MHAAFARMKPKPQIIKHAFDLGANFPQVRAIVTKDQKVVAVADVIPAAHLIHDRVVEAIEQHIGKKLTRQVADGQPSPPLREREKIIALVPLLHRLLRIAAIDDQIKGAQQSLVGNHSSNLTLQYLVVDAWEKLDHIAFQNIFASSGEYRRSSKRTVRSLAHSARIRMRDKPLFEMRFQYRNECVMHDAVAKRRGADHPWLGFEDVKRLVLPRSPVVVGKFASKAKAFWLQVQQEPRHIRLAAFALRRGACALNQMFWIAELRKEFAAATNVFRHEPT